MSALRKQKQARQAQRRNRQRARLSLNIHWQDEPVVAIVTPLLKHAAALAWLGEGRAVVNITFVSSDESQQLNKEWREKDKPTNVLSFPFELPEGWESREQLLGDLVICPAVLISEAREQGKSLAEHAAHLVVHGLLHLQGYDHENEAEAQEMEALEAALLAQVGMKNPYLSIE
jgi:probable rRNA maturation factor